MAKIVEFNMDTGEKARKEAGHLAQYYHESKRLQYKSVSIVAAQVVAVCDRFDGRTSIKLINGDCVTVDLAKAKVDAMLRLEPYA